MHKLFFIQGRAPIVIALLVGLLTLNLPLWQNGPAPGYEVAAQLLRSGQFDARVYDDQWYSQQVRAATHNAVSDIYAQDLPTLPLFLWPIAVLPASLVSSVWPLANAAALLLSVLLTLDGLKRKRLITGSILFVVVTGLALLSAPLQEDLLRGQVYLFILLLHALVFWAVLTDHDRVAGAALGLLFVFKINGWPVWIVLIALRRWRVLRWAAASALGVVAISIAVLGADIWRVYFTQALPSALQSPIVTVPAYQTVNGFFQHFFRYDATWNPSPLIAAPWLAALGSIGITLGLLAITWFRSNRHSIEYMLGAAIVLSVILSPQAEQYHFLLLIVPVIILAQRWRQWSWPERVLLISSIAVIAVPLPYKSPAVSSGFISLLAYPRLYGALIMWWLLCLKSPVKQVELTHA